MTEELKNKMTAFYTETDPYYQRLIKHFQEIERLGLRIGNVELITLSKNRHKILDCGCGSGSLCVYLNMKTNVKTYGTDISPYGIQLAQELARKTGAKAEFKVADIEKKLPFPNDYFDLVIMHEVMEHLVYPERAVSEVSRVLRKGGIFFLAGPSLILRSPIQILLKTKDWAKMIFDKTYLPKTLLKPTFDIAIADSDAVYLTNSLEVRRMLSLNNLKVINGSYLRCIFIAQKISNS